MLRLVAAMRVTPGAQVVMAENAGSDPRWDRLRRFLLDVEPGQTITVAEVADVTGLGAESVDTVLRALARAALFTPTTRHTFVRDRLSPSPDAAANLRDPRPGSGGAGQGARHKDA